MSEEQTLAPKGCYWPPYHGERYDLAATVYFRESTDEWVLEIRGDIRDTNLSCRHAVGVDEIFSPADVPGLPHLYELEDQRDEADRRAGAAERKLAALEESERNRNRWLSEAKKARGYDDNVSFDTVWEETCKWADAAKKLADALARAGEVLK